MKDKADLKAFRVSKKSGGECVVVARDAQAAIAALPGGADVSHIDVMESYENAGPCSYGGMTAGTPMPVIVAGSDAKTNPDGSGQSY